MPRPRNEQPTPAELEVMKIVWERGPVSVRDVWDALREQGQERAYTSVMSLLGVMTEKKFLKRRAQGRAFVYAARLDRGKTLGRMVGDLCQRAFEGSASTLVSRLLDEAQPTAEELAEIRNLIESYQSERESGS